LRWQAHFIQKFEMEDRMEMENVNRGFDRLDKPIRTEWIRAWEEGKTGYPLVDACMRCLCTTGYVNFRMRAMLVSFLTHHLWQPWQVGSAHMARQFLDFEPGIHFPQFQMQAGMTGINTLRIYNPIKQAEDHDTDAVFIKEWVPELRGLPALYAREPWQMTEMEAMMYDFRIGHDYPPPIVDVKLSAKQARDAIWRVRKQDSTRKESQRILSRHTIPGRRNA
jgi:deoxyribodipyrimidine photo-lyase